MPPHRRSTPPTARCPHYASRPCGERSRLTRSRFCARRTACPRRDEREGAMNKIEASEIKDLTAYEKAREAMRSAVIALKRSRRVSLGDHITLLFENRETVAFQIQEMVRTERIVDEAKVA